MSPASRAPDATATELAPVREALLRRARTQAARLRAEAGADRDRRLDAARRRADEIRAVAEQRGRDEARAVAAADVAAAERAARRIILEARRRAYDELVDDVRARVATALADPAVQSAFRSRVGELLGPDAVVTATPGTLAGTLAGRRVEITAQELAEKSVRELGRAVEELWEP